MAIIGSRTAGTGYTNLSKILNKNQGNKPGMGTTLASGVQQAGLTAQNAIGTEKTQFEKESDENRLTDTTKTETGNLIKSATSGQIDPTKIGESVAKLQGNTGAYQGPSGVSGQGAGAVGRAASAAGATVGGLLQGQYGRKAGYNPALRRFDEALVSRSPEYEKIRQAQVGASQVGDQYNRLANYAADKASTLAAEKRGFADETQKQLSGALTGVEGNIDTQLTTAKSDLDKATIRLQDKIRNRTLTNNDPDLALLESSGMNLNSVMGSDTTPEQIASFLQSGSDKLTKTMVMTPEQANALRALNALSGKSYEDKDLGIEGTVGDQTGAGMGLDTGYNTYAESVNKEIAGVEQAYKPQLSDAQTKVKNAIQSGQALGIDYVPGEDYNMTLHNAKAMAYSNGDSVLAKKIADLQGAYGSARSTYDTLTGEANKKLASYTGSGGKYNTLRDILGLSGKDAPVAGPESFLSGYSDQALDSEQDYQPYINQLETELASIPEGTNLMRQSNLTQMINRLKKTVPSKKPNIMYKGS